MTPTDLLIPEKNEKGLTAVDRARALSIVTKEDYTAADQFCSGLKELEKEVDAAYDEHISDAFKAHRSLVAKKKVYAEPIDEARKIIKGKMIVWKDEQERLQRIEEERLAKEAKAKTEQEALDRAAALEAQGDHEAASAAVDEAALAPAPRPVVESYVPKSSSVFSTRWSATITDPLYVLKAIEAAGKVLAKSKTKDAQEACDLLRQAHTDAKYMTYDQVALNRQATATKDALKLGGVVFSSRKV